MMSMPQQTKTQTTKPGKRVDKERGLRVKRLRDSLGFSQGDLAEMLELTQGAIVKIEKGFGSQFFYELSVCLKADLEWIMTGHGKSPFPENMKDIHASLPRGEIPVINWNQVAQWVDEEKKPIVLPDNIIGLAVPLTIKNPRDIFALCIKNDAMVGKEIKFKPGAFILIDRTQRYNLKSGNFIVCQLEGSPEAILRQYMQDGGKEFLKPLNENYDTYIIEDRDKFRCFGVVIELRWHIP